MYYKNAAILLQTWTEMNARDVAYKNFEQKPSNCECQKLEII